MLGVAMFSLLVLRVGRERAPAGSGAPLRPRRPTLTLHADETAAGWQAGDPDAPERTRLRMKKGISLKDDLADMVREDPDAAAAILKSWIGKAG